MHPKEAKSGHVVLGDEEDSGAEDGGIRGVTLLLQLPQRLCGCTEQERERAEEHLTALGVGQGHGLWELGAGIVLLHRSPSQRPQVLGPSWGLGGNEVLWDGPAFRVKPTAAGKGRKLSCSELGGVQVESERKVLETCA